MTTRPVSAMLPVRLRGDLGLLPAERLLLSLVLGLGLACVVLATAAGRVVEWGGFAVGVLAALALVGIGVYVRTVKSAPRLALAAIGVGVFMSFTAFVSIFIFSLFPLPNPLVDHRLIAMDAALGYDWAGFVQALAEYPLLGRALGWLYGSSLPQIVLVIVLLAALGRETALHRMLLVGMLAMAWAVGFWWLWPSIGPSAFVELAPGAAERIGLVVSPEFGARLIELVQNGPAVIAPEAIIGVVAFPSYHIIMALMVAWYALRTPLFLPLVAASLGMVPATLAHGGHHLMDLAGGLAVFLACLLLARWWVPARAG